MTREILVAIHAGSGIIALVIGPTVFSPPPTTRGRPRVWRTVYAGLLVVLFVSLAALIAGDWAELEIGARVVFTGLATLAAVMLTRIYLAYRLISHRGPEWKRRYVSHVYFTYISLWVGFAIIPALRSPNPGLWIPVSVVAVLAAGTHLFHRYQRRLGIRPS